MRFQIQNGLPKEIIDTTVEGELLKQILTYQEVQDDNQNSHYHFCSEDDLLNIIEMSCDDVEILIHNLNQSQAQMMLDAAVRLDRFYQLNKDDDGNCEVDLESVGLDIKNLCLSLCQLDNEVSYMAISWSNDGDPLSMNYDIPGGNAMFITKNGIKHMSTQTWIEEQLETFGNDDTPTVSSMP